MVTLYSTDCPKCKVLKAKLELAGIDYIENHDVAHMRSLRIMSVPVLEVDGKLLQFSEAIKWLHEER